ncbi:hypothetical protein ACSBR1_033141 [Camellia fascicularis]
MSTLPAGSFEIADLVAEKIRNVSSLASCIPPQQPVAREYVSSSPRWRHQSWEDWTLRWFNSSAITNTTLSDSATRLEIGDFENWMRTMEFDCKSVSAAIYNIHQA